MTASIVEATSTDTDSRDECSVVIDARTRNKEVVCGEVAVAEVLVKNDFGLFVVLLCSEHRDEHREFYKNRTRMRSRPRRHI